MMCEAGTPKAKKLKSTTDTTSAPAVVDANESITFHLLKKIDGVIAMEEDGHFNPEMSHQLFGEEEQIKGYDGLEIDIFFTPRFQALIDVKYASKSLNATDLKEPFTLAFPAGFCKEKAQFDALMQEEKPFDVSTLGEELLSVESAEGTKFSILKSNLATASQEIKDLHAHLEPLLLFYVDAASAIDATDSSWDFLLAVETSPTGDIEIVGFTTAYSFYVFPDRKRVRLSQILVLPPHQGRGVGSILMEAVYKMADSLNAVDITFEDPTEDLQRMRDKRDLQRMLLKDWMRVEVTKTEEAFAAGKTADNSALLAASPELLTRIQTELRMSKQQSKRMWETLFFAHAASEGNVKVLEALEQFITTGFRTTVSAAKKDSADKSVRDIPGITGEMKGSWVMSRVKRAKGANPSAIPNVPVEECSAEQQEEAIQAAAAGRLAELQRIVMPKEDDEGEGDDE